MPSCELLEPVTFSPSIFSVSVKRKRLALSIRDCVPVAMMIRRRLPPPAPSLIRQFPSLPPDPIAGELVLGTFLQGK